MLRFWSIVVICFVVPLRIVAQDVEAIMSEIIEEVSNSDDENFSESFALEMLEDLLQNPINLNTCSFEDLKNIPFLSDYQINAILEYRIENFRFYSLGELKGIEALSQKELKYLKYVLTISDLSSKEKQNVKKKNYVSQTFSTTFKTVFEIPKGYKKDSLGNSAFLGSPQYLSVRYRCKISDKLSFGFASEKDPGEAFEIKNKKYGFDFNSGYIKIANCGFLEKLIIGDFAVKVSEGLLYSNGYFGGKFLTGSFLGASNVLKEYTSLNEVNFFRGTAALIRFKRFFLTTFFSRNYLDAKVLDDSFSAFKLDGYHRTESEKQKENTVLRNLVGMVMTYNYKKTRISAAYQFYNFNKEFCPEDNLSNVNYYRHKKNSFLSLSYEYASKLCGFKTEVSVDKNFNHAVLGMLLFKPVNFLNFSFLYRNYSKKYLSFTANSFAENSKVSNEDGLFFSSSFSPFKFLTIDLWADVFRFLWLKPNLLKPSSGYELFCRALIEPIRKFSIELRYRQKIKDEEQKSKTELFRLVFKYLISNKLSFTNFVQLNTNSYSQTFESGHLIYSDIGFKGLKETFSVDLRYALFSSPYITRLYAYESDVSYSFSFPSYYYKGVRYYLFFGYKFSKLFSVQLKLSRTRYLDRNSYSSGVNFVSKPSKTELHFLLKLKF